MMSSNWYVRSKYSRLLCERFSVEVPCASGALVILSSSCTTEYTADCPRDRPRTIQTSSRSRRREGTNMVLSCLPLPGVDCKCLCLGCECARENHHDPAWPVRRQRRHLDLQP